MCECETVARPQTVRVIVDQLGIAILVFLARTGSWIGWDVSGDEETMGRPRRLALRDDYSTATPCPHRAILYLTTGRSSYVVYSSDGGRDQQRPEFEGARLKPDFNLRAAG